MPTEFSRFYKTYSYDYLFAYETKKNFWKVSCWVKTFQFLLQVVEQDEGTIIVRVSNVVFIRRFWRKVPDFYSGCFFRRVTSTLLFICSTTWTTEVQNTRNLRTTSRTKKGRRWEPRKHTKDPPLAFFGVFQKHLGVFDLDFFRHNETFFKNFWIAPKSSPFNCFDNLQPNGCLKISKDSASTFFGTVTLFKNLIFWFFFENFLMSPKCPPSIFSKFWIKLEFQEAQRVLLLQFLKNALFEL